MKPIVSILVPTDFSSTSDAAFDYARMLAERFGASLHLLHVVEDPLVNEAMVAEAYISEIPDTRFAMLEDARARLAHRLTEHDRVVLRATSQTVLGHGATTIVEHARARHASLIVMGTHGRTGLAHILIGSVAERVVRTAPCPVLTVRGEGVIEETRAFSEATAAPR
jgi:nucleotide-binding universal stress UspA family protein